jgi:putative hemolysin
VPKRLALTRPRTDRESRCAPHGRAGDRGPPNCAAAQPVNRRYSSRLRHTSNEAVGVTVDEIRVMLEQGAEEGVFVPTEHEMVTNVLKLDERYVGDY